MAHNGNAHSKAKSDNHANQLNPNNETYWEDRGYDNRPEDWEDRVNEEEDDD